uniref:G protein-coupled receptor n=1 Tax=Macrostomum lignano TaxID=282301 RepID=A0A1I8GU26_9PLAT
PEGRAHRVCHSSGRWLGGDGHPVENISKSFSNYSTCFSPFSNQFLDGKSSAEISIIGDVLSSMSLAFAVAIFCCYSSLSSVRNKIHRNLFIAMLMQILAHLLLASREIATSRTKVQAAKLEF